MLPSARQVAPPIAVFASNLECAAMLFAEGGRSGADGHVLLRGDVPVPSTRAAPAILGWVPDADPRIVVQAPSLWAQGLHRLREAGCERYFWAIDPHLKSLSGAVTDNALNLLGADMAVIAPAWPRLNFRTLGAYQIHGHTPVDWPDNQAGIRSSYIPEIIGVSEAWRVATLHWNRVKFGIEAVLSGMFEALNEGKRVLVVDALCQADLGTLAKAITLVPWRVLPIGCAGLLNALQGESRQVMVPISPDAETLFSTRPVLGIVATQALMARPLDWSALPDWVRRVPLPIQALLLGESRVIESSITQALTFLLDKQDVVFHLTCHPDTQPATAQLITDLRLSQAMVIEKLNHLIAELVREACRLTQLAGIISVGEESSACALSASGARVLRLQSSPIPGTSIFRFTDAPTPGYFSVLPAWQFEPQILGTLMRALGRLPV